MNAKAMINGACLMPLMMLTVAGRSEDRSPKVPYEATWESLAKAPVPRCWDDGKFGVFIHWGPYSVAGYKDRMQENDVAAKFPEVVKRMAADFGAYHARGLELIKEPVRIILGDPRAPKTELTSQDVYSASKMGPQSFRGCFKTRSAGPRPATAAEGKAREGGDLDGVDRRPSATQHSAVVVGRSPDGVLKQPLSQRNAMLLTQSFGPYAVTLARI